jgi:hypothetical protein
MKDLYRVFFLHRSAYPDRYAAAAVAERPALREIGFTER